MSGHEESLRRVFDRVAEEREYQDILWGSTMCEGKHSITEMLVYIRDYVEEGLHIMSREPSPQSDKKVLPNIRKIAAMAVATMQQHGAPARDFADLDRKSEKHNIVELADERLPRTPHPYRKMPELDSIDLSTLDIRPDVIAQIESALARRFKLIPIDYDNGMLTIVIPDDSETIELDELRFVLNTDITFYVAPLEQVNKALAGYYPDPEETAVMPRSDPLDGMTFGGAEEDNDDLMDETVGPDDSYSI